MPDPTKHTVSASQVAALFDLSPYLSHYMLYQHFAHDVPIEPGLSTVLTIGKKMEEAILELAGEEMHLEVVPHQPQIYERLENYRIGCTKDASVNDPSRGPGVVEAKYISYWGEKSWPGHVPPPHVEMQLQTQMLVLGASWGVIAALTDGAKLELFHREPNKDLQRKILDAAEAFFRSLEAGEVPPQSGHAGEADVIRAMFTVEPRTEKDLRNDEHVTQALYYYRAALGQRLEGDKAAKRLRAQIINLADGCEVLHGDGIRAILKKTGVAARTNNVKAHNKINITIKGGEDG